MNIWIFNHYAVGPGEAGFTRHYDLAQELIKKNVKVTIIASSFNYQTKQETKSYKGKTWYLIEEINGVKFVWLKTMEYKKNNYKRVINMLEYSLKAYWMKNKLKDTPTHIIGSLMHPFAAISGAKVSRKMNAFFIFEERDLWPQSMIDLGNVSEKSIKVKFLRGIENWLINSSDKTLLLFDKAKQYMYNRGVPTDKLMVVSNGVSLSNYKKELITLPNNINESLQELNGKFLVAYTGAHGMANNLDMVLDAAKILQEQNNSEIHFILLGDGVHKQNLVNRATKEKIFNVSFFDSISKDYMPSFLDKIDVGLLPLHNSPVFNWGISPNKMYDYMAAKLPVIILTDIERDALHKENPGILIRGNQAEKLVENLNELQKRPDYTSDIGKQGFDFIQDYCSWEVLAVEFLNQLEDLS